MRFFRALGWLLSMITLPTLANELPFPQPVPQVYTAGQPSQAQLAQAAANGIRTVIDLRAADEDRGFDESHAAGALGLRYVSLPIGGAGDITEANARSLQNALQEARERGPVLLHCASSNRVGALMAIIDAKIEGNTHEAALELGRRAGLKSLEPVARAVLDGPANTH